MSTTTISTTNTVAYGIYQVAVDGSSNNNVNIYAGESTEVSGYMQVSTYPYGTALWMENIVLAFILPEGISINEDSIKLWTTDSTKTFAADEMSREVASDGYVIYKIYAPKTLVLGQATESIDYLTEGINLNFSVQLNTSIYMGQQTVNLIDSLFCYSTTQTNDASGSWGKYATTDDYDLNNDGNTTDKIGCITGDTSSIEIIPQSATFEVADDLEITHSDNRISTGTNLEIYSKDDVITYNLDLKCTGGGTVNEFEYYMPIPKVDFNAGGYLVNTVEKAFDMTLQDEVNISGQDLYDIYYTLDTDLSYSTVGDDSVTWYTSDEITENDSISYSEVTIIKITPKEDVIENGSDTKVSMNLKYNGDTYAEEAGMTYTWASCGHYTYKINGRETSGNFQTNGVTVTLTYEQEMSEITLTAAKNMTPLLDGNVKIFTTSSEELPTFLNSQDYKITNVETYNVNLQTKDYMIENAETMPGSEANVYFGITASLNSGSEKDILSTANSNNIEVGEVSESGKTTFTYTLYNANDLSNVVETRYIIVTYETDNGVTLTQKINIILELTDAEDPQSSIVEGNRYRVFDDESSEITISQDSSFTAQFVANYIPDVYTEKTLTFSNNLPVGTSIIILDKLENDTNYTYGYYVANEEINNINLKAFKKMGTSGDSYENTSSQETVTEIFLVLVDFKDSEELTSGKYTLKLDMAGDSVEDVESTELTFNIKNKRTFEITTSPSNVKFGEDFAIFYAMQASSGNETLYSGKKVSIVLTATSDIPEDTYIIADGTIYYHNLYNQFIIPCSNVIGEDGKIAISINSNMLENKGREFDFKVELWVGATSSASLPLMGESKTSASLKVQDETKMKASLKVTGMTARLIKYDELSNTQEITFNYIIDSNCIVTIELQQKIGSAYEKVSDKLNSINGSTAHTAGVYTVLLDTSSTSGTINFKLSTSTDIGTYRLVFKIYDENNQQILEVPYNFLVI